jgi:hypothetical protein
MWRGSALRVKTGKDSALTSREGPYGCGTSRLPHHLDNRLTVGGKTVSPTCRSPFMSQENFWQPISIKGWVNPWATGQLERVGKLKEKKSNDIIGNRTPFRLVAQCLNQLRYRVLQVRLQTDRKRQTLSSAHNYFSSWQKKKHESEGSDRM